ncbi:hypothetical protein LEMLEM_LOCUS23196 [Lemmus lemmus]
MPFPAGVKLFGDGRKKAGEFARKGNNLAPTAREDSDVDQAQHQVLPFNTIAATKKLYMELACPPHHSAGLGSAVPRG